MPKPAIHLPLPHTVFQRNADGFADIPFAADEPVDARVYTANSLIVEARDVQKSVPNVPVGGPYTLEISTTNGRTTRVGGLLVGDLWVMAGQSNMDGSAKLVDLERPIRMVHCFYYNERWAIAEDPLCRLVDSVDPVHWPCPEEQLAEARAWDHRFRELGASMGIRFGKDVFKGAGVPIGLIMCSHGGTSIEQWDPALRDQGGRSLYGSMMRRIGVCGGRVAGMLWYQGESNANPETAPHYKTRMTDFIHAVRRDLDAPDLPFIQVQLSRFFVDESVFPSEHWNRIQQVQLEITEEVPNVGMAAAIDSTLSDAIHIDAISGRRMGARLAEIALTMAYGKQGAPALTPSAAVFRDDARTELEIAYANVRGELSPKRGLWGYWIETPEGERIASRDSRADGRAVTLLLDRPAPPGSKLWYGRGCNPTVNLHDDLFAAPVFGPWTLD